MEVAERAVQAPNLTASSDFTPFFSSVSAAVALTDAAGIPRNCTIVYVLDESSAQEDIAVRVRLKSFLVPKVAKSVFFK
jgi:hypothetical protein